MIRSRAAATAICMVVAMLLPLAPAAHASQPPSAAAAVPVGASKYVAVPPTRLADTRPTASGYGGFTMVNGSTMRVSIIGRPGVPAGATAAVLNVAMIEPASAGYATVYPGGEGIPATSSLNADQPGRSQHRFRAAGDDRRPARVSKRHPWRNPTLLGGTACRDGPRHG